MSSTDEPDLIKSLITQSRGRKWITCVLGGHKAMLAIDEVTAATEALWALLDEVLDPATRILAVGFSQGGLMATQLLRTRPERIAATVVGARDNEKLTQFQTATYVTP